MNLPSKDKIEALVKKIQNDPDLLKEFEAAPAKTIEKVGGFDIPDLFEGTLEKIIKENIATNGDKDPMEIINKYLK